MRETVTIYQNTNNKLASDFRVICRLSGNNCKIYLKIQGKKRYFQKYRFLFYSVMASQPRAFKGILVLALVIK